MDRLPVTPEDEADCVAATERINKARANYAAEEYIFAIIGPQPFSIQKYNEAMRYPIVMREYADAIENYLKTLARVYHGYVEP